MHKRLFYVPILITLALNACNTNNNQKHDSDSQNDGDYFIKEKTEITFLCMADTRYIAKLKSMVEEFEKIEPNVTVNLNNPLGSGDYTMLEKSVVAGFFNGNYPDIVQCYPDNVSKYMQRGYVIQLDDYLNNPDYGIDTDGEKDYIESFLNEGASYNTPGTYSLPFCKSTELMYYNADVLIGLDLKDIDSTINNGQALDEAYLDNLTWEELFGKLCPAIKAYNDALDAENKIYVDNDSSVVFTYDSDENFFITLANQYGYGYTSIDENGNGSIDFDNSGMKSVVRMLRDAKDNKYLHTKKSYKSYVSSLFTGRECLFTVSSTAGLSYNYNEEQPFRVGVAKIPHAEGKEYSSINQGPSVCLLDHKDENRALASFLLWKHITNKENSSDWAIYTGYMGIRNSSYQSEDYQKALVVEDATDLYAVAQSNNLKKIADVRSMTFNTPVFKGSGNARTNVGLLLRDCLITPETELDIDAIFASYSDEAKTHL